MCMPCLFFRLELQHCAMVNSLVYCVGSKFLVLWIPVIVRLFFWCMNLSCSSIQFGLHLPPKFVMLVACAVLKVTNIYSGYYGPYHMGEVCCLWWELKCIKYGVVVVFLHLIEMFVMFNCTIDVFLHIAMVSALPIFMICIVILLFCLYTQMAIMYGFDVLCI